VSWPLIPAFVIAAITFAGYLNERRKTRLAEGVERRDASKFRRDEDQEIGEVINRRVEMVLLNLSTERDRLAAKVDQLERLGQQRDRRETRQRLEIANLRTEVASLKGDMADLQAALKAATGGR
jgi:hypothetical protein